MRGVLLLQLGTPTAPTKKAVAAFLREFLSDPKVVELPWLIRWALVFSVIAPLRAKKVAKAYQSIWMPEGSPLRFYSTELAKALEANLNVPVRLGMRYQEPTLKAAVQELHDLRCDEWVVLPLFPQFAPATTGSALEKLDSLLKAEKFSPRLQIFKPFFKSEFFVRAWCEMGKKYDLQSYDHILFSYHGLPEGQLDYQAQCQSSTDAIAESLQLPSDRYSMSFQSRFGPVQWLKPYTEERIRELAKNGVRRLAMFSPSFVCDGLETLEELGIRGREMFLNHGGKDFLLVPSLNLSPVWIDGLLKEIREQFV